MRVRLAMSTLLLSVIVSSGCYSFRLRPMDQVPEGAEIRARVSGDQAGRLSDLLGSELGRDFTGRFIEWSPSDQAIIEVRQPGAGTRIFQRVDVPRSEVLEMEVRAFDATKTALVGVPIVGLLSWLIAEQFNEDANRRRGEDPPIDQQLRIRLIRFGW